MKTIGLYEKNSLTECYFNSCFHSVRFFLDCKYRRIIIVSKPIIANILAILIIFVSLFVLGFLFSSYFGKKITMRSYLFLVFRTRTKRATTHYVGFENSILWWKFPFSTNTIVITETLKDGRYMVYILLVISYCSIPPATVSFSNTMVERHRYGT